MSVDDVLRFYAFVVIRYEECYRPKGSGHSLVVKDELEERIRRQFHRSLS